MNFYLELLHGWLLISFLYMVLCKVVLYSNTRQSINQYYIEWEGILFFHNAPRVSTHGVCKKQEITRILA